MSKIIMAPGKYIQGDNEMAKLESYTKLLGSKVLVLLTEGGIKRFADVIKTSYETPDQTLIFYPFGGECSRGEVQKIQDVCTKEGVEVIMSVGGGKCLDAGKAAAYFQKLPIIVVPTIASTDAPCSALSVLYTDEGEFAEYLFLPSNPSAVIVDTQVVANAPSRLLVAGIGDALATYFEARACVTTFSGTCAAASGGCDGGIATNAAYGLSKLCYEILLKEGLKAKIAVDNNCVTAALENIIEANTLLSGIGFESCGLAGAHAIHNGLTVLECTHDFYHGEKVAFGTIAQLVLENAPTEELAEVINFCKLVGLPTTLAELGITEINPEDIMKVAEAASVEGETIHNMPGTITAKAVYAAILTADKLSSAL